MLLAIAGFAIIFAMIYLLFRGKTTPVVAFVLLPLTAAILVGFTPTEIAEFVTKGVTSTWKTAALFIFSVTYFGIMSDAGMFDKIIKKLVGAAGNNITLLFIVTSLIAMFAHLDGSGATTFLITIPALMPLYKKLHLRVTSLLLVASASMGVMNLVPWGGSTLRAATVLNMDATELWRELIPVQVIGLVMSLGLAIVISRIEIKRLKSLKASDLEQYDEEAAAEDELGLKRPKLLPFNLLLTLGIIVVLMTIPKFPSFAVFMIGVAIALPVNYPSSSDQNERIKAHAPAAMLMAITLLSAGVLLGIMTNSGMIDAMANTLIQCLPDFAVKYLHLIVAALTVPIHLVIGTDPYYYGLLPIVIDVVGTYGIPAKAAAFAMLIGENVAFPVSAVVPSVYLGIGLAGVEYKEHLKYSFKWLWGLSVCMLLIALLFGLVA